MLCSSSIVLCCTFGELSCDVYGCLSSDKLCRNLLQHLGPIIEARNVVKRPLHNYTIYAMAGQPFSVYWQVCMLDIMKEGTCSITKS